MDPSSAAELDAQLSEARAAGQNLHRHHARGILIALGRLLAEDGEETPDSAREDALKRVSAWQEGLDEEAEEAWQRATAEELSLACAEHVQSVDPRFLDHPRYDIEYTRGARQRLEARLVAARELGLELPETLIEGVRSADAMLEPYLRGQSGRPNLN